MTQGVASAHVEDRLPDLLLGDIRGLQAQAVFDHLSVCVECANVWRDLQEIGERLTVADDDTRSTPRPVHTRVRQRLLARAARHTAQRAATPYMRAGGWFAAGAAAAGLLWLTVGGPTPASPLPGRPVAYLVGRGRGTVYLDLATARATLSVRHLPPLAAGHVYEAWWVGAAHLPAGTFAVDNTGGAVTTLALPRGWIHSRQFGVTVEPAPGTARPTTPRLLGGDVKGL